MALAVYKAKEIGDGIVNGGPSLSGNSLVSGVAAGIIAATGIGRLAMSGAAAANSFAKSGNRLLWGQASSSGGNSFAGTLAGGGSPFGRGGGNSAWDRPPTDRQQAAAKSRGISLSGMNRGQASQALERAGLDPSWFRDESSGGASLAPASVPPGTGPAGAARAGNPFSRAQTRMRSAVGQAADAVREHGVAGLTVNAVTGALHGSQAAPPSPASARSSAAADGTTSSNRSGMPRWHPGSGVPSGALNPAERHQRWEAVRSVPAGQRGIHEGLRYSYQGQWEHEQSKGISPYGPPPPPLQHPEHLAYMAARKRYEGFAHPSPHRKNP